ncbi:hypothetical protein E4U35_000696 [Claviceps purpurea]|nr:hypothetical protein E4U37_006001 [Claviceps purpurea]KAG6170778.1 hypothetical protein E4U51_000592 [Claviceps purpurea]KAG6196852.1 hypothetical protein E4U10_000610 [Claviceps purpurea]KAG6207774.1 hypothetical protein E4U35_000696 [Claviceps purpurea]KAG6228523.1 hypothetical protein E4U26_000947 [Claviceps purpurea]
MVRLALITSLVAAAYAAVAVANSIPGAYIVELEDGHDHAAVLDHISDEASTRMAFDHKHFRGLSFQFHNVAGAEQRSKEIAAMSAVKQMWPVRVLSANMATKARVVGASVNSEVVKRDGTLPKDTFAPHVMTQVDRLRAKGITGKGVKIAVVDTGIDWTHPALGNGCFGKGCLVSFGTDLVGDAFTGHNKPIPGNKPLDCAGHGTHVAGIIAAQPNPLGFTGAATGVTLGAYRISGCEGDSANDVLIAAFNKAFEDGANIITSSFGEAQGWSEDPWAVTASRIVQAGVPVTIAAGNDGGSGLFFADSGASGKGVTAVARYNTIETPLLSYQSSYNIDGGRKIDFIYTPGDEVVWGVSMPLYATSLDYQVGDDACQPLPASTPDLSKYIVLVRRGGCGFTDKLTSLVAKGAQYVMFYNNEPGIMEVTSEDPTVVKATGMVSPEIGIAWVQLLKAGRKVTINVASLAQSKPSLSSTPNNITGGAVSPYSSWGPTWEMEFKPQIGTPGGSILSTWPVAKGSYAINSGTSMSCPLAAAIIALVSEVRGTHDPELMTNLLSSTAKPSKFNDGSNTFAELAPAPQQGGGLVQAYDAAYTTSLLSPASLSFNDTDHLATNLNFTITNKGSRAVTYKLDQIPSITMYTLGQDGVNAMSFPNEIVNEKATLSFSQNSITLPAGHSTVVGVTAKPAAGAINPKRLALWSGYVTINGTDGSHLSMPYQGLTGSLRKATVLERDQAWLFPSEVGLSFTRSPEGLTFVVPKPGTLDGSANLPAIYINLALGCSTLRVDVVPVQNGTSSAHSTANATSIGEPFGLPSQLNERGWSAVPWNGKLESGKYAPEGQYRFVARALRLFGDASNPQDWDVVPTLSFILKYKP